MLDPRLLRTFLFVCRHGSISAAARQLNVSQPSVSVAVAQLERALSTSLLTRGRQGIVLTAAGRALEQRAAMLDALLTDASQAVALADQGVRGPLRIGGTPGALVSLVPGAIAAIERDGPLALTIVEGPDAQLAELLRRGEIDLAVVTTGLGVPPPDIEERSIARDTFALIVGRAHAGLPSRVDLKAVVGLGWVLPQAAGAFHRQIDAMFLAAGLGVPANVIRCDSLLTSKAIVASGARVTVLPRGVIAAEQVAGTLRALTLTDAAVTRSIGIRTLRHRGLSAAASDFLASITDGRHDATP